MYLPITCILLPLAAYAARIVLSNDDGWAEMNIRSFYRTLTAAGNDVILSAPADNQSGRGSLDAPAKPRIAPCHYHSCPANGPPSGFNASNPHLNYVNSYPVTSIKHGITTIAPKLFGNATPDLAVTGPNVGSNLGGTVFFSGTVGAAVHAAHEAHIPAIAFSGSTGAPTAWNVETRPFYSEIYARLATKLTEHVLAAGPPYLPADVWLNVNFPLVTEGAGLSDVWHYEFVLSRILTGAFAPPDVETCGSKRLPTESSVMLMEGGRYVSVSVGDANNKRDASAAAQAVVLGKLKGLLSCLPTGQNSSLPAHNPAQGNAQELIQN